MIGVPATHPLAGAGAVEVEQLDGQIWVASRSDSGDSLLGVWPGLRERPDVRYVVRDWLAKLQIVAAGLAITTIAPVALGVDSGRRQDRRRPGRAAGAAPRCDCPASWAVDGPTGRVMGALRGAAGVRD